MELYQYKSKVVGVDISLGSTHFAIIDIRGNIIARDKIVSKDYPQFEDFARALSEAIINLCENNGGFDQVRSIGVSCPSGNPKTGCMHNSPNMPWKGVIPVAALLQDQTGKAVALCNDDEAIGLGELTYGSAHGLQTFISVNLGHGFGGAYFYNRKLMAGSEGFAGEIGHTCLFPGGRQCGCGLKGCAEAYVAAKGIVMTARELMESGEPTLMRDYGDELSPKKITECCDKGDKLAIETYRRTGEYLGIVLANFANIIDTEAILLAGGIFNAGKWIIEPTLESFQNHIFGNIKDHVKIIYSELEDKERKLLGASALAWDVKEYSLFK